MAIASKKQRAWGANPFFLTPLAVLLLYAYPVQGQTVPGFDPLAAPFSDPEDRSRPSPSLSADPLAKSQEQIIKSLVGKETQSGGGIGIENAAEGEWIQGEEDGSGVMKLYGRIRVRLGSGYLLADRVIVDTGRKEIYAEGNVIYVDGHARVTADRMIYDQRLGAGILYNGDGYKQPLYFTGKNLRVMGEGKFAVSHAWFTTCAAKPPHYEFRARRLWVQGNERIVAVGVMYYVGGVPVLPLPFFYASEWGTGIISQFGYSRVTGAFWQNTYQFSVPTAASSAFAPMSYRVKADTYEKKGNAFGLEMYRFSPSLSYVLDLGYAEYHRYEIVADNRSAYGISATNRIARSDGTYGEDKHKWKKAFALISWQGRDASRNSVQKLSVRYEDYTHRLYEYEYGGRFQPETTIPALYKASDTSRGLPRANTDWNLTYNDQRDDLSLTVKASRARSWVERPVFEQSSYEPTLDVAPSVQIEKKMYLGRMWSLFPVYWDNRLSSEMRKYYTLGVPYQDRNLNEFRSGFRAYFSFYPYITFRPYVGAGAQKATSVAHGLSTTDADVLIRQAERNSYQYAFQEHDLTLGPQEFYLRSVYRRKDSYNEELLDATRSSYTGFTGRQRVNEDELSLHLSPVEDLNFQFLSVYDFREYGYTVKNSDRWSYPVFRTDMLINLLNPFRPGRENLLSRRRSHFFDLRIVNDYVYDPINKRDHSDLFGVVVQMGGFDLWLLERLRYLEFGYYWYHVYYQPSLDHMRFHTKMDVRLTKIFYLELQSESRLTRPDRYDSSNYTAGQLCRTGRCLPAEWLPESNQQTSLGQDVLSSLGANGARARENTAFNLGYFEGALVVDLHDWEMRFGYIAEQRSMLASVNSVDVLNYYDNKVFLSITFLRFDVAGISRRPSRFILNRQRVRAQDVGRSSISSN